jgi:hypothetical protein
MTENLAAKDMEAFEASLGGTAPPAGLPGPLRALWHAARGEWDAAHGVVQDDDGAEAAWVHAHLHREEGDLPNARYWYSRAGRTMPVQPVEQERRQITSQLLAARS